LIEVKDIDVFYKNIQALRQVSISVHKGEIVSVIGPNGSGKSTLLKAIAGLVPKKSGEVYFEGQCITGRSPADIVRLGIALVPAGRRLFGPLSVEDNLQLGAYLRLTSGQKSDVQQDLERVFDLFPPLKGRIRQAAGSLSGGEQQMVAIGRALMARPKAILMDEPSLGLAPIVVRQIFRTIKKLGEEKITILLIEQNAVASLQISDRTYVLSLGRTTSEGRSRDLLAAGSIGELYLNT
jgi:branched-chain amino acid transport system ATP-binding protein